MTYIVNDNCIKCKLMDCMEVCPVDCFYEGENMLAIKPDECIEHPTYLGTPSCPSVFQSTCSTWKLYPFLRTF